MFDKFECNKQDDSADQLKRLLNKVIFFSAIFLKRKCFNLLLKGNTCQRFKILHTFLQQQFRSHYEVLRFEWKSLQNDNVTLWYSILKNYFPRSFYLNFLRNMPRQEGQSCTCKWPTVFPVTSVMSRFSSNSICSRHRKYDKSQHWQVQCDDHGLIDLDWITYLVGQALEVHVHTTNTNLCIIRFPERVFLLKHNKKQMNNDAKWWLSKFRTKFLDPHWFTHMKRLWGIGASQVTRPIISFLNQQWPFSFSFLQVREQSNHSGWSRAPKHWKQ